MQAGPSNQLPPRSTTSGCARKLILVHGYALMEDRNRFSCARRAGAAEVVTSAQPRSCGIHQAQPIPRTPTRRPRLRAGRHVLREELLHAGFGLSQGCAGLPLGDEFAIREQLRELLGDRVGVGLVVAGQHQTGCLDL